MTQNPPTGGGSASSDSFEFDRTLSPSDPSIQVGPVPSVDEQHVVVRDNSSRSPAPAPAEFREKETVRDLTRLDDVPAVAVTPAAASEYAPPRPAPAASLHKTIETELVQLDPEVHPRTAPTIMDARRRARAAVDPREVPTQPMPIQMRRATRRRLAGAVAVACLGAGGALAVVLSGASYGSEPGNALQQSLEGVLESPGVDAEGREPPTLAIDVRHEPRPDRTHAPLARSKPDPRSSTGAEAPGSPPAGHAPGPRANQPRAQGTTEAEKAPEKRTVWLE
jgi:hypothetical protein